MTHNDNSRCCTTQEDWEEMNTQAKFISEVFKIVKKYCNNGHQDRLFVMLIDLFNEIMHSDIFSRINDKKSLENYVFRLLNILTGSIIVETKCSQISIIKHRYCRNNKCKSGNCSYLDPLCGYCYNSHNPEIDINDALKKMCKRERKKTDILIEKYSKKEK